MTRQPLLVTQDEANAILALLNLRIVGKGGIHATGSPDRSTWTIIGGPSRQGGTPDNSQSPYCRVKQNGTDGTNPKYDLYAVSDVSMTGSKLNTSGALVPKCSRARWQTTLPVTAATNGSVGSYYVDEDGSVQLFECQETVASGECAP